VSSPRAGRRPQRLPLLAVRDVVVFPHMVLPLSVGRAKSIQALEAAMKDHDKMLCVVAQRDMQLEDPTTADLYTTGVLVEVVQYLKMPDGTLKVFLQGLTRILAKTVELSEDKTHWEVSPEYPEKTVKADPELKALMRHAIETVEEHSKLSRRSSSEALAALSQIDDPSQLADTIAANALTKTQERQTVLEAVEPGPRLEKLIELLKADIEILTLERKIHTRVKTQIEKTQKEYYLQEQMKAIQKELRQKDDFAAEIEELRKAIKDAGMPKPAEEAAVKELGRLEKMMPYSPESTVSRTYLDWMIHVPWSKRTRDQLDLKRAHEILEADHYDLKKVKERILEYLAVTKLTKGLRGPILCFVGPPGVGKTSLGKSIAKSMGRKFARISLGGVRDESEIRGHRRTYIGSLPGRIIQSIRKAGSKNCVILLDEIDKMGSDWRGDPSAALLEVLDPEQNAAFNDHYLDVDFDLSQVMFICTANTLDGIPNTLLDRLEVLRFPGYTHNEKKHIATTFLITKQIAEHGLKPEQVEVTPAAVDRVIDEYTRESGVRNLNREFANLMRKAARKIVADEEKKVVIDAAQVPEYLGIPKFQREKATYNGLGVSTGLAWTEVGGVTMPIEVVSSPGKGVLQLTGKLGSVMQESAQAAMSYIKSISKELGIAPEMFKDVDYHVHVPEGAIPKDGPSAGLAIATALTSLMTGRPVLPDIAMTGEMTLRGRALPIGGLKEKTMAAHREGVHTVLYPEGNRKDVEDIPQEVLAEVKMIPVKSFHDVITLALAPADAAAAKRPPQPPPFYGERPSSMPPGGLS
jgi:ATP-dependent Lon protease